MHEFTASSSVLAGAGASPPPPSAMAAPSSHAAAGVATSAVSGGARESPSRASRPTRRATGIPLAEADKAAILVGGCSGERVRLEPYRLHVNSDGGGADAKPSSARGGGALRERRQGGRCSWRPRRQPGTRRLPSPLPRPPAAAAVAQHQHRRTRRHYRAPRDISAMVDPPPPPLGTRECHTAVAAPLCGGHARDRPTTRQAGTTRSAAGGRRRAPTGGTRRVRHKTSRGRRPRAGRDGAATTADTAAAGVTYGSARRGCPHSSTRRPSPSLCNLRYGVWPRFGDTAAEARSIMKRWR